MRPGIEVTKEVILASPKRMRYETFEHNHGTPPLTYKKTGRVTWVDWKNGAASVRWSDGTITKELFKNLEERKS